MFIAPYVSNKNKNKSCFYQPKHLVAFNTSTQPLAPQWSDSMAADESKCIKPGFKNMLN